MAETKSVLIDTKTCSGQTKDHYHTWTYSTVNSKIASAGIPSNAIITSVVLRVVGRHEWTSILGGNANITISAWFCPDNSSEYMSGIKLISATRFTNDKKDTTYSSGNIVGYFNTKSPFNITESSYARLSVYFDSSNQIDRTYYTSTYLDFTYEIHNHSYDTETSRTPATCLASGSVTKKCSCGETQTTTLAKLSHSYTGAIKNDGNSKTGTHSYKCVNGCNNYGGAVTHTWNSGVQTTAPTCTANGVKTYTCTSGCGGTYTESIPALGHSWGTITYTWSSDGKTCTAKRVCSRCGTTETSTATITSKVKTPATCTVKGTTTYTATFSVSWATTQTKDVQDIATTSHTQVTIPAVAPTCTQTGLSEGKKCSVCGTIITAQQTVNALGHNYVPTVTQPTESSKGYTTNTCSRCGDSYVDKYTCLLTLKANNNEYGTVSGGKICNQGDTVTITATANEDYSFVSWNDGVTSASRVIGVTESITYTAYFKISAIYVDVSQTIVYTDTTETETIYVDETIVYG